MKKRNVWKDISDPLEIHKDQRGVIADIFYGDKIEHVAIIKSKSHALRGDHYHKETTQIMLITKGSLEYWYKPVESDKPAKYEVLNEGDIVTTPPYEVHALRIMEKENEFIVFTKGKRGGKDYESDTFRVKPTIII
tara:strand:+ start:708 stop:1115 length:408 start_codon:yes stop_codon:yes gene_type:complete